MPYLAAVYEAHHLISWLLIGAIAGALAGRVARGAGFGCIGDIIVGLVGAVLGGAILHFFTGSDVAASFVGECAVAFVGAAALLILLRVIGGAARG